MKGVFSVSELNWAVNARLSSDPDLARVRVRGEISGLRKYASGHSYFTLKDENASVSCVLFSQAAKNAPADLRDGMQLLLFARTNLYDKTGRFQLIVDGAEEEGTGDLYRRFMELKRSLEREGLFDKEGKKPIPWIPDRIVAVTSAEGAVIRDIIHVLRRRFPGIRLILIPVPVQGAGAEGEIAAAIELANILRLGDVLIVGRGGGSLEDLQPFNEEVTARAIAASRIPVISAVGHETDFTIADFVADLRAPTPSAAAELAVPVKADLLLRLDQLAASLEQSLTLKIDQGLRRVADLSSRPVLAHPAAFIEPHRSRLELFRHRLYSTGDRLLAQESNRIDKLEGRSRQALRAGQEKEEGRLARATGSLGALSPLAVLTRGYALVTDRRGRAVPAAAGLGLGEAVDILFRDGEVGCEVTRPYKGKERNQDEV